MNVDIPYPEELEAADTKGAEEIERVVAQLADELRQHWTTASERYATTVANTLNRRQMQRVAERLWTFRWELDYSAVISSSGETVWSVTITKARTR